MTQAQFIERLFINIRDPYNSNLRNGQIVMNTLSGLNPKLHDFIVNETNYDCFYDNNLVASTIACIIEHPEYWDN